MVPWFRIWQDIKGLLGKHVIKVLEVIRHSSGVNWSKAWLVLLNVLLKGLSKSLGDSRGCSDVSQGLMQAGCKHLIAFFKCQVILVILIIFPVFNQGREFTSWAGCNLIDICLLCLMLLSDLISAASAAISWASGHFNFPSHPVDLRIVLLQPWMAEDEALFPKCSDCKQSSLWMVPILQDEVNHLHDWASFIQGSINIVHQDWGGQWSGSQLVGPNIISVDEQARPGWLLLNLWEIVGTSLLHISCFDTNLEVQWLHVFPDWCYNEPWW